MIVRIADKMGAHIPTLVPFGKGLRADMGQTRGAQSGEADRHAVWLTANNLEPRLSPFDPFAILDEIQRLVPGYDELLRLQLLSGNDQHLDRRRLRRGGLVQIGEPPRPGAAVRTIHCLPRAHLDTTRTCCRICSGIERRCS